jgi:AcrR family transcriptional regulator
MSTAPTDAAPDADTRWSRALATRATRERGRRTLVKLLDAAVEEFSAHGYQGARVARVAKRAGTSHGTFYLYFKDRDDLLLAVFDDLTTETVAATQEMPAILPGPDGFAALRQWVAEVSMRFQRDGAIRVAVLDALHDGSDPRIARHAMRWVARSTSVISERIRATGTTGLDPEIAAVCIYNLIDGGNRGVFRGELKLTLDELIDGITECIQRSVYGA